MKKTLLSLAGVLVGLLCATGAYATPIETINLNQVYTGYIPDGSAPWLTATLGAGSSGLVLTLTSSLTGSDFLQGLQGKNANGAIGWAFNFNGDITGISCDSSLSSNCASTVEHGGSYNAGPVPGTFNLAFGWDSGNRFQYGDTAVYDITLGAPPSSSLAAAPTQTSLYITNNPGWYSVAHIQGINQTCSGWVVGGNGTGADGGQICSSANVPEPPEPSIMLLGMAMLGGLYLRRRLSA